MDEPSFILETPRLRMRRLTLRDLDDLSRMYADPEIRRYFPDGTLTREQTAREIEWFQHGHPHHPELGLWATIHRASHAFIGRCGLLPWTLDGQPETEVAYLIDRPYWRQGLATEAATALVQYGFHALHLNRLVSLIEPANLASARVAMNTGMTLERTGRDEHGPYDLYSIHRNDARDPERHQPRGARSNHGS